MAAERAVPQKQLSRGARLVGRFVRRSWQALVVGVLAIALGVLAFLSPGLVQADVHLDEGTVHAAKRDSGLIGIVNAQIDELAAATAVGDSEFTILQEEDLVLVHGLKSSTLVRYNPARNRMESPVQLPSDATVQLAGGTLLVVNPDNGRVWFGDPETVLGYDFQKEKAKLEVGEFGTATVTASGEVIGLNVTESVLVRAGADDTVTRTALPFTPADDAATVALSAVGDLAVVLDRQSGRIWMEGTDDVFEVSGASSARLVPAAPDALGGRDGADAIYATQAGLIALTPDGPRSLSGNLNATPIEPVQVGGCIYGAFGDQFVKLCRDSEPEVREIPGIGSDPLLSFQVNRGTVALNDASDGTIWMVDKDMLRITDWERVVPPQDDRDDDVEETETVIPPDRTKANEDPVAADDTLAARAGRSTVLNVLDNDTDPDGDVLTITAPPDLTGASLQTVRGGSGLQVTVEAETTGTLTFSYTVDDGRGGKDTANVTVRVLPADPHLENNAPYKHERAQPVTIQLGQTVSKRVLLDWRDPEGDSLILVDAWLPPDAEDEVSFTPDGQVTFLDIGKTTGTKTVFVRVSDGYSETDGELVVIVTDDTVAPIAYGDYETVTVGKTVTINPLANDIGANLALTEIDAGDCGCVTTPNYREGWFTFTADAPGSYYVTYKVSNGPIALGLVRIDVRAETTDHAPVAALDVALLPPGGTVMIDPVLNDTDDDGDVLVVQSVSQHPGLQVVLERRHLVTITAHHTPEEPVTLSYRLSDGKHSVLGTIVVIPTPTTGSVQPLAERDEIRVRAGSTQAVNVLANDTSPIGLDLTLDKLVENPLDDRAWIDGQFINVSIPPGTQASNANLTYQIRDADGAIASTQLRITVVSEDAQNEPPAPRQVVERVLAGTTSRLAVPLEGIDPNGDAVRLIGLGSGPQLGRVLATGDGWISYEAFPSSQGTDVFSYQVIDSYGAIGIGEIRVGVAPPGPDNSSPTGVPDEIRTRPGRHVQIPALRNDLDIDGDGIAYVASDPVEFEGIEDVEVVDNRQVSFVAPEEPGTYVGNYYIEDSRGAGGSGDLTVVVDPEAPLLPPETRDDLVSVAAVIGKDWVEVDVLANDFDPDGVREDLTITVPADNGVPEEESARATEDGSKVTAPVTDRMQQLRYVVTDADGGSDIGLILLPGRNDSVPVLKDPALVLEAVAGQPLGIELNSFVAGTAGRTVRLTGVDTVSATHGRALPGAQRIEYTPDVEYEGPASVVFEVGDVVSEGDKTAKRAYISIPVKVLPAPNRPDGGSEEEIEVAKSSPELIGSQPHLLVGPGEGDARLDLMPLFRDPDGDSFYFDNFAHSDGDQRITWTVSGDGSKLYASAPVDTPPGTVRTLRAEAIDANSARTPFTIQLEVTSSTRPLATAVTDVVDEAIAGQQLSVPALLNDKSNLLQDQSLTLVAGSAKVINGSGTASTDGDSVTITPSEGFVGTLTASYTIEDATKDPDRRVDGTIRVTVKDRPSRPGAPRDGVVGNGTVTFTYTPGSANGFEILSRTAVAINAAGAQVASTQCPSTTCTMRGLPNGQPYQFEVVETNQAGASDPSPRSAAYTPDVKPLAPAAPTVDFGDSQLSVAWAPPSWEDPSNPGSPVDRYLLALLDEAGNQVEVRQLPPSPTSYTWTGLTNGTRYRFKLLAGNKAGESPYSDLSAVNWPAAPPNPPAAITATATENPLGGAFDVSWPASGIPANGDPIRHFVVTPISQSGVRAELARTVPVSGAATQSVLIEGLGQVPYRFQVVAVNKAGAGSAAATPQWQTAFELPKVTSFRATAGDGSIQLAVATNFDGRTEASPRLEYRLNGGSWTGVPRGGLVAGLVNGRSYDVEVRVVITGDRASAPAAVNDLMPRAAAPPLPGYVDGSARFLGWEQGVYVSMGSVDGWEEAQGWDPAQYKYACDVQGFGSGCSPSGWTGSHDFVVDTDALDSASNTVSLAARWGTGDYVASETITLADPFMASWDASSRTLTLNLEYVRGPLSCTATFNEGVTDTWTTPSFTKQYPELVEGGLDYTTNSVDIRCSNSNFSGGADIITVRNKIL
ncbi:Ig-like domain-containing protein [Tessaracoccus sp. OS52]|uniref:Ig-like domain-containing protein n=1 Tax=Tessaracoccus sp. OS52 TaxID=2886691 RepID=UPI001D11BB55|nr:Ig-like domain-containing protein [Tessaracoccus sp. OS52]MCC2594489.1 Ig-like domain-containing protein [Tessaracoccus sp. OS52]